MSNALPQPDLEFYRARALPLLRALMAYHRHDVTGIEHVPRAGAALVIMPHAMLTYDTFLLQAAIFERTGRLARGLGDRFWYDRLKVGPIFEKCGLYNTSPETARAILASGELVGLTPGGMWEALRPSTQRFQLRWEGRTGFARLSLATGAPIVLSACPAADLALTLHENPLTDYVYRRWKLPLPLLHGLGPTVIPRPVRLTHHLRAPIVPPRCRGEAPAEDEVKAFRDRVEAEMIAHLDACRREEGLPTAG
jgi:hypothetical protein